MAEVSQMQEREKADEAVIAAAKRIAKNIRSVGVRGPYYMGGDPTENSRALRALSRAVRAAGG